MRILWLRNKSHLRQWLLALLISCMGGALSAQLPSPFGVRQNGLDANQTSRVWITRQGKIIMPLGNYDVVLGGPVLGGAAPTLLSEWDLDPGSVYSWRDPLSGQLLSTIRRVEVPQVIFKTENARVDGRDYLHHRAYPYDLVARHHNANRIVGRETEQFPPLFREDEVYAPRWSDRLAEECRCRCDCGSTCACMDRQAASVARGRSAPERQPRHGLNQVAMLPVQPFPLPPSSTASPADRNAIPEVIQPRRNTPDAPSSCWFPMTPDAMLSGTQLRPATHRFGKFMWMTTSRSRTDSSSRADDVSYRAPEPPEQERRRDDLYDPTTPDPDAQKEHRDYRKGYGYGDDEAANPESSRRYREGGKRYGDSGVSYYESEEVYPTHPKYPPITAPDEEDETERS